MKLKRLNKLIIAIIMVLLLNIVIYTNISSAVTNNVVSNYINNQVSNNISSNIVRNNTFSQDDLTGSTSNSVTPYTTRQEVNNQDSRGYQKITIEGEKVYEDIISSIQLVDTVVAFCFLIRWFYNFFMYLNKKKVNTSEDKLALYAKKSKRSLLLCVFFLLIDFYIGLLKDYSQQIYLGMFFKGKFKFIFVILVVVTLELYRYIFSENQLDKISKKEKILLYLAIILISIIIFIILIFLIVVFFTVLNFLFNT